MLSCQALTAQQYAYTRTEQDMMTWAGGSYCHTCEASRRLMLAASVAAAGLLGSNRMGKEKAGMLSKRSGRAAAGSDSDHAAYRIEGGEALLLERAKHLEPAALEEVYDRYAPRIFRYIYRRLGSRGGPLQKMTAEDLTGEVFLRMLEAIRQDKTWQTSFSGWLYRIAHNLVVDHFRDRSRTPRVSLDDAPPLRASGNDPAQIIETRVTQEQLLQALRGLTDDQAQVMVLRFVDGHSIAEVARIMDKTSGAVKGLQYRAAVALRHSLGSSLSMELGIEAGTETDRDAYGRWRQRAMSPSKA